MSEVYAVAVISAVELVAWDLYGGGGLMEGVAWGAIVFSVLTAFGKALLTLTSRERRR